MRLTGLRVDGFGILHEQYIESIPEGLSLFFGENESGKTTLHAFLRYMLFGFPVESDGENTYPPLRGGSHGGNLKVMNQYNGLFTVERRGGTDGGEVKVTLPDGSEGGQYWLNRLLGNATRELYNNIFAFTLSELQRFETLNQEEVRAAIYSAGLGAGQISLPEIKDRIQQRLCALFRSDGEKDRIGELMEGLHKIREKKSAAAAKTETYAALCRQMEEIKEEIAVLGRKRNKARSEVLFAENLIKAWDNWVELWEVESQLKALPAVESFPDKGAERLRELQEKRLAIKNRMAANKNNINEITKKIEEIPVNEKLLAASQDLENLQKGRDRFDSDLAELERLRTQAAEYEQQLNDAFAELGEGWDRERLLNFNCSLQRKETVRSYKEQFSSMSEKLSEVKGRLEMAQEAARNAEAQYEEAEQMAPFTDASADEGAEKLDQRLNRLRAIREKLDDLPELEEELEKARQSIERLQRDLHHLRVRYNSLGSGLPAWPVAPAGIGGLILAFILLYSGLPLAGLGMGAFTLLAGGFYLLASRSVNSGITSRKMRVQRNIDETESELGELQNRKKEIQRRYQDYQARMAELCGDLDISDSADKAAAEKALENMEKSIEEMEKAAENLQKNAKIRDQINAKMQELQAEYDQIKQQWKEWLNSIDLPQQLSPDGAFETFATIENCRHVARNCADVEERIERITASLRDYATQVREVEKICSHEPKEKFDAGAILDALANELNATQQALRKREVLEDKMEEMQVERKKLIESNKVINREINRLLEEAGASDEEDFAKRVNIIEKRAELEKRRSIHESALNKMAGPGDEGKEFRKKLESASREELELQSQDARKQLDEIESEMTERSEKYGSLKQELRALESEDELGRLRLAEQCRLAEIKDAVRQWCIWKLAILLLKKARVRYEEERQPAVIKNSNEIFCKITDGAYDNIIVPRGEENTLMVSDGSERRKGLDCLSRGAREQLYLAVRFGLIREFSRSREPLPIIMDDVIVNFDRPRAKAAVEAMMSLAATHQILFFACHPQTCEIVREVNPDTPVFRIENGCISRD